MVERTGDIWDYYDQGYWVVITTNGTVKKNGEAVMGRGVALQAKLRFPSLPLGLGEAIKTYGNRLHYFDSIKIVCLPTKYDWHEEASIGLIRLGLGQLTAFLDNNRISEVYMPRPGCGNGKLNWKKQVKPILEKYLDDRFIIVQK